MQVGQLRQPSFDYLHLQPRCHHSGKPGWVFWGWEPNNIRKKYQWPQEKWIYLDLSETAIESDFFLYFWLDNPRRKWYSGMLMEWMSRQMNGECLSGLTQTSTVLRLMNVGSWLASSWDTPHGRQVPVRTGSSCLHWLPWVIPLYFPCLLVLLVGLLSDYPAGHLLFLFSKEWHCGWRSQKKCHWPLMIPWRQESEAMSHSPTECLDWPWDRQECGLSLIFETSGRLPGSGWVSWLPRSHLFRWDGQPPCGCCSLVSCGRWYNLMCLVSSIPVKQGSGSRVASGGSVPDALAQSGYLERYFSKSKRNFLTFVAVLCFYCSVYFFYWCIVVRMLVSGIQKDDSVIHISKCFRFFSHRDWECFNLKKIIHQVVTLWNTFHIFDPFYNRAIHNPSYQLFQCLTQLHLFLLLFIIL